MHFEKQTVSSFLTGASLLGFYFLLVTQQKSTDAAATGVFSKRLQVLWSITRAIIRSKTASSAADGAGQP